jgi:hypothetical protein
MLCDLGEDYGAKLHFIVERETVLGPALTP